MSGRARALAWAAVGGLLALHAALWLTLPSRQVSGDALDDLAAVEAPSPRPNRKHPAAEPAVWLLVRGLRTAGHEGPTVRVVQIWNGAWLTLGLAAVAVALGPRGGPLRAGAAVLLLGGGFAALHLALDPMLFFVPPGLALLAGAAAALQRGPPTGGWGHGAAALALLLAMVLVDPMTTAALLPLAWGWVRRRDPAVPPRRVVAQGVLLGVLPLAAVLAAVAGIEGHALTAGPFGTLRGAPVSLALEGLQGALWPTPRGIGPLAALGAGAPPAGWAATAATALLAAAVAAGVATAALRRGPVDDAAPWLLGALLAAGFVVWWNPNQFLFWVHPLWMGAVAAGVALRRPAPVTDGLALGAGAALLVAGLAAYALPAHREPAPWQERAERIGALFGPEDVLMFPVFPDPYVDYYGGGVRTSSMVAVSMARPEGLTTFEYFSLAMDEIHARGGRVYFLEPEPGEGWVRGSERERARLDYTEADFARFEWGAAVAVGDEVFREALELRPAPAGEAS